jgi:23S rRNA pseudouridine2605 synthase
MQRLQKILARAGIASRRAAEKMIAEGRVRLNGRVVRELGKRADPRRDRLEVDGKRVVVQELVYLVLHKPRGYVTTLSDPEGRASVAELVRDVGARVFPVGRLDFATSGALLFTNDGDFAHALLHPRRDVPKTYVLKVAGEMKEADLERWRRGVELEDGKTKPAKVKLLRHESGKTWIEVTITEGRNQQIRRMGDATGFRVMRLVRQSFAGITHEGLRPGAWRFLTPHELATLKSAWGVPARIPKTITERAEPRRAPHRGRPGRADRPSSQRDITEGMGSRRAPTPPRGGRPARADRPSLWEETSRSGKNRPRGPSRR